MIMHLLSTRGGGRVRGWGGWITPEEVVMVAVAVVNKVPLLLHYSVSHISPPPLGWLHVLRNWMGQTVFVQPDQTTAVRSFATCSIYIFPVILLENHGGNRKVEWKWMKTMENILGNQRQISPPLRDSRGALNNISLESPFLLPTN